MVKVKGKGKVIFITLPIALTIILLLLCLDLNDYKCRKIIESYGWHAVSGGKSWSFVLNDRRLDDEFKLIREASKSFGYDPIYYKGRPVDEYSYVLEELGLDKNSRCQFWLYYNKIICCYLTHAEPNLQLKFWPINTEYAKIRSEIEYMKKQTDI